MPQTFGGARPSLRQNLDRDVLQIVQKIVDDDSNRIPRIGEVYNAIQSSNSSLKRKPKKTLEDSIERVLDVIKEDQLRQGDDDDEEIDDLGPVEGEFDGLGLENPVPEPKHTLNSGLLKMYAAQTGGGTNGTKISKPEADQATSEGGKRRKMKVTDEPSKRRKIERTPAPNVSLADLGGVDNIIDDLEDLLLLPLLQPETYENSKLRPPRGVLLHGPPGCGKTMIANAFAAELGVPFINISAPTVVSGMSGESEKALREHFDEAKKIAPCILFIDEIDAITPKRESAQRQMETRIVAQLLTCMDDLALEKTGGKPVVVMAATNRPDSLDPALRRGGRFDKEINMTVPNEVARERILGALTREMLLDGELQLATLAKQTAGFVGADLRDLVDTAGSQALKRFRLAMQQNDEQMDLDGEGMNTDTTLLDNTSPRIVQLRRHIAIVRARKSPTNVVAISQPDFEAALLKVQPSSKREGFATIPDTNWRNIGALKAIRRELETAIVKPIQNPALYKKVGITAPAGVLLWGPPGCGKTLLAKAVANESKANFISVKGPELLNKYVGESEREVRKVFTRARSSIPCIILFDELDALVPRRGSDLSESSARVVNTLLTELDGLSNREGIYVIGATNRPDVIDPAMLRPGRLETPLYVDLPGAEERKDILETLCKNSGVQFTREVDTLARECERYSGADLEALRVRAGRCAIERESEQIEDVDWIAASKRMGPSVSKRDQQGFERLKARFGNSAIEIDEIGQEVQT